ncbi:BatD family protein [Bowmanella dokdonensis]|uniref:Protein BatD n=1 Tax=Bowmanella dokdonensis TaxID=751969 RepID=A0A939IS29_9ALTE|nr:BatD family protein [Bowmanella dokdonensis]MBN7826739.1 protein BatD [Bowmanella dokdonensis]
MQMNVKIYSRLLTQAIGLLCLAFSTALYADVTEVTASVDKNPAMVDEGIVLTVTANDAVDNNLFDPSPLLKDFVTGRTSVSTQTKIVNFDMTRTTTWTTHLIPRQPGRYQIPSFEIQGQKSQPISLTVLPVSQATRNQSREIFITTETDLKQVHVQQQIHYRVKLHLARDLQRGSLAAPKLSGADIRQVGKDKEYSEIIDGQRYRIIERRFAIIPHSSGQFQIEGPLFEGEVIERNNQSFGFFNQTRTITRAGPDIEVEVLPVPANYPHHWLPSEYVELHEEWQSAGQAIRVGEPVTRTLTLTALGVTEEQLPELASDYPDSVKTYPDQANNSAVEKDETLVAQRVESIAIIPSRAGKLELPAVRVPWFNIVTKKTEYATVPAKTLEVLPALPGSNTLGSIPPATEPPASQAEEGSESDRNTSLPATKSSSWWSVSSYLLLVLWLLTLFAWWWQSHSRGSKAARTAATDSLPAEEEQLWNKLYKAVRSQDAQATLEYLPAWLGRILDNGGSLADCQQQLGDAELNEAINQLMASRFGRHQSGWQAGQLAQVLKRLRQASKQGKPRVGTQLLSLKLE